MHTKAKGDLAEQKAKEYLEAQGFEIIDQNVYSRFGEIDLITKKNNTWHFIEVKSGSSYEVALQNLTPSKINKIVKTIYTFLKKNSLDVEFSVDAVIVTPEEVELIENITI
ncbi:MAG: YraN family protein [Helicobacteraceae bacterium]|nr:YraN family protein [Helicobacteraceae bacterium]